MKRSTFIKNNLILGFGLLVGLPSKAEDKLAKIAELPIGKDRTEAYIRYICSIVDRPVFTLPEPRLPKKGEILKIKEIKFSFNTKENLIGIDINGDRKDYIWLRDWNEGALSMIAQRMVNDRKDNILLQIPRKHSFHDYPHITEETFNWYFASSEYRWAHRTQLYHI